MSQINFYATRKDLLDLLCDLESRRRVCYAQAGVFDRNDVCVFRTYLEIPNLGSIDAQHPHQGDVFLVGDADAKFSLREVPQRRGGMKFALDQKENPDTISFLPGGQFDDQTIVAGNFGTCTDSHASLALFGLLNEITKEMWEKIKSYLVGPQAVAILDAGGRLTAGLRPEYDLHR